MIDDYRDRNIMTFAQLLTELATHGIGITVTTDSIKTNVPAGKIPDHIKQVLRLNKTVILAILHKPLKTFDSADNLLDAAIALGGKVATGRTVKTLDGKEYEVFNVVDDDGAILEISEGDEFGF